MEEYFILRFKHYCVKIDCFDVFIFLTFLSDVIVNGQTVQFWHHCCCNKTKKNNCSCIIIITVIIIIIYIHVVGMSMK